MYVLVGAQGSWTIRELGFQPSPQRLAVGSAPAGHIGAALGELPGFWEPSSTNEDEKPGKHPVYVCSFSMPASWRKLGPAKADGLGRRHRDGGSVPAPATPLTCSLLDFSYSDSHLDALAGTQLR